MKLWLPTANGPQRSRCGKIGSPEGLKMPTFDRNYTTNKVIVFILTENRAIMLILLKINEGVGIFYE